MIILFTIAAFVATFLGGMFALKFKDKLHLILGFSAGAVIAVAFLDLIPEAIELTEGVYDVGFVMLLTAIGFAVYMLLDRTSLLHSHHEEDEEHDHHGRGVMGAGSISFHSFLDGFAVGLAFQVSTAVGLAVALAVLVHNFSDGINAVSIILKNGGDKKSAFRWLLVAALAPVLGIIATLFFSFSDSILGLILAVSAGFFLYIGASDLLPESHHKHPTRWTTAATVVGMAVLYMIIKIAGI